MATGDKKNTGDGAGKQPSEKELEKAADIRAKIEELKAEAAKLEGAPDQIDAGGDIVATVVRNVPDFMVRVNEGNVCSHGDEDYQAGDKFRTDGPTAMSLASFGHVTIEGVATDGD